MLTFEETHDCVSIRPLMYTEEIVRDTVGVWPFKKVVERKVRVYETRTARWTCPECKSVWDWRPALWEGGGGYWSCRRRTTYIVDQNGRTLRVRS